MKALALFVLLCWAGGAQAACRQALALGLDVSGSVDAREYRLQLDGLAGALNHPEVREALLAMPGTPVRLAVYDWSGPQDQRLVLGWTEVTDSAALDGIVAQLRSTGRGPGDPSTAIGAAMMFGAALVAPQGDCWKRTLDISGDGKSNTGPHPRDAHGGLGGITVNALVVGADQIGTGLADLSDYFRAYVISGADAFVETALGFEDFEAAMVRKLKRELIGPVFSRR
ncbi:DUF1194 domain-containing protein [Puniceibacterium sediminis]|uniref:VWFA domain-containing protein n=1 Tax=Puniceibacterium sediminis TaxID=1608407 RepID=A0A238YSU5_9RHOB|nr:DUF1194 domain-containing protein [Puniceibacterium sediminis]SNR73744.1 Protein of unknown function [Puniceibacterium sediminis]